MKILFLTQFSPYPPVSGGAVKTCRILTHLAERHEVSLVSYSRGSDEAEALSCLPVHRMRHAHIDRSAARNVFDAARSLLGESFIISRDRRMEMQRVVDSLLPGQDLVYVDHLQMFQFVPQPAPCPVLLDEHNVEWRIIERFAHTGNPAVRLFARIEWPKLQRYELAACRAANVVLTVSEEDRKTLLGAGVPGERVHALPIGVEREPVPLDPGSRTIVTFGQMAWPPNADAVTWFARTIFPRVRAAVPDARFLVIGANPPPIAGPGIEVAGFVPDLRAAVAGAALFVAPLRVGSGMRVKIVDAMALGLPTVTTSVGCEGIPLTPGEHALVADIPEEFAKGIVRLLRDPKERERLAGSARAFVAERYSWGPILTRLDSLLAEVGKPTARA
ncbi:MAG: glycosyltransferase family 4 protein [Armatimonadota bacterium]